MRKVRKIRKIRKIRVMGVVYIQDEVVELGLSVVKQLSCWMVVWQRTSK
jgi:hypothetical protein